MNKKWERYYKVTSGRKVHPILEQALEYVDSQNEEMRFLALGITNEGRFLTVIFTVRKKRLIRVISARDMSRKERKAYEE